MRCGKHEKGTRERGIKESRFPGDGPGEPALIPAAVRLAGDVDGVVSVVNELTSDPAQPTPDQAAERQA